MAEANPRRLKRMLNTYQVIKAVANAMPMSEDEPNGDKVAASPRFLEFCGKLIKWLILCECYPYRMSLLVLKILDFEQKHLTNYLVKSHHASSQLYSFKTPGDEAQGSQTG